MDEARSEDQKGTDRPVILLDGDRVSLGPLRRDLVPLYHRWITDFATLRTLDQPLIPLTLEQEQRWYEQTAASESHTPFTIYERGSKRPIGTMDLRGISHRHGSAELGILIGEADCRGKGYGTEAVILLLDYAFTALGLNNVMLWVAEFNLAGRRAYQKAGFKEIGRRRRSRVMGGRSWDSICMDCIAGEFSSPVLSKVLAPDEPRAQS